MCSSRLETPTCNHNAVLLDVSCYLMTQAETTPLQDPFQPSSTPLGDARRYLCWNRVGTIISVDEVHLPDVQHKQKRCLFLLVQEK